MEAQGLLVVLEGVDPDRQYLRITFVDKPYPKAGLKALAKLIKKEVVRFRPLGEGRLAKLRLAMLVRLPLWLDQRDREFELLLPANFATNLREFARVLAAHLEKCEIKEIY